MKFKILSCSLAASAILSVQPVTIINSTSVEITLYRFDDVEEETNGILNQDYSIQLQAHKSINMEEINSMRIAISQGKGFYQLNNLKSNVDVIFGEWDDKFHPLTNDDSIEVQLLAK